MTKDFDAIQHPEQKSKEHGKRDAVHGPHEHGLGAKGMKPGGPHLPFLASVPATEPGLAAAAAALPSFYYAPWTSLIPRTDQGNTPQCVAYADAYDQNQQDRPEMGKFVDFDEATFFAQIGGTADGSYVEDALARRQAFGYPEQGVPSPGHAADHRIASYAQVVLSADGIKTALTGQKHGLLVIGPWFHSWFHPLASGKLPAPDYEVGGHCWYLRGYNDTYGAAAINSWGTSWGNSGRFFLPYAFLARMWAAYITTDR